VAEIVSLDEAIAIAIELQQGEEWVAAGAIYRTILEAVPDHPDAVHYSGVLAHQEGRSDDALALIRRSLELAPERADWHSNLAIVLRDRLELDDAIAACRRAIAIDPAHANAHNKAGDQQSKKSMYLKPCSEQNNYGNARQQTNR